MVSMFMRKLRWASDGWASGSLCGITDDPPRLASRTGGIVRTMDRRPARPGGVPHRWRVVSGGRRTTLHTNGDRV